MNDPIKTLEDILKRNGHDLDLRDPEKEEDRHFLFDRIADPADLDLAWSQFPAHSEIRTRAAKVDAVSDIVSGWGYRVAKKSNRCSDTELTDLVRRHIAAVAMLDPERCKNVVEFLEKPYDVVVVGEEEDCPAYTPGMKMEDFWGRSPLFNTLYETASDWMIYQLPRGSDRSSANPRTPEIAGISGVFAIYSTMTPAETGVSVTRTV